MRIDIHTHISPDRIAAPVLEGMTAQFGYPAVGVNTIDGIKSHMRASGVDKSVVLGLVSTKTPELEQVGALVRRVDQASRHIPAERLALSPQCGFASTVAGNPVTLETQKAKLGLVQEAAQRIWG